MKDQIRKELRLLRLYVVFSVPVLGVLLFAALAKRADPPYFEEITVERINVVEPDGRKKLVIASSARQTEGMMGGVEVPLDRTRPAGLIYFNDHGDEVGGLIFGGDRTEGAQSLTFDQAGQDQVFQLLNQEWTDEDGWRQRNTGILIVDRPTDRDLLETIALVQELEAIEDPEERGRAYAELQEAGAFGAQRMFVGRTAAGQAAIVLRDGRGKARLRFVVEEDGTAFIDFLDADGNVVRRLGPDLQ